MKKSFFNIDSAIMRRHDTAMKKIEEPFKKIEEITQYNQEKVLAAFISNGVSESHFVETTG
ncbi:MAG TPA: methionine gamma-lyase family protein, partial [Clostridiales bacterium]|nr:methionine gamma-lyase family protein [Clostridiales bacterium]